MVCEGKIKDTERSDKGERIVSMLTKKYLLLTGDGQLIAKALLEGKKDDTLQLKLLEGKNEEVSRHKIIELVSNDAEELPLQCCLLHCDGVRLVLKRIQTLNAELRRNLRIPIDFESYLYPVSGGWRGRKKLRSVDLSCGGIAFYADNGLETGETVELVIPRTTFPILVRISILRKERLSEEHSFYAGKFLQLQQEEERMIREAVFSIQLKNRRREQAQETEEEQIR